MRLRLTAEVRASVITVALMLAVAGPASAAFNPDDLGPSADASDGEITAYVLLSTAGEEMDSLSVAARPGEGGITMYCYYYASIAVGFEPAPDLDAGPVWPPVADEAYFLHCEDPDGDLVHAELLIYDPGDPFGGLDDSEAALALAMDQLDLPQPVVGLAPAVGDHLVGLPSWFWTDTPWTPVEVSAQLGAVTSTVTATPVRLTFDPGDGSPTVTCDGPGTPWREGLGNPPPCGHTYQRSGDYPVTATISWEVAWTSTTGQGGPLPDLTTTTTTAITADEAQAVLGNG